MDEEALVGFWLPYDVTIITPEGSHHLNQDDYLTVGVVTHRMAGSTHESLLQAYTPREEMRINFNPVFIFYPKIGKLL